ncbi:MAG: hypothetical protein IJD90_00415, partial [Clostridia bacterium]|nr:hypothetical protein [Clostridia bacterium]
MFNINIDTVRLYFPIDTYHRVYIVNWPEKIDKTEEEKDDEIFCKKTNIAYYEVNKTKYFLTVNFSLQKLQHKTNEKDYNWLQNPSDLINILNADIQETVQNNSLTINDAKISRIDLNTSRSFAKEKDAKELFGFFERGFVPRAMTKKREDLTTINYLYTKTKSIELRVYRKDKDQHLPVHIREGMDPTLRIEFQYNRAFRIRKFFGTDNLSKIMYNPELSQIAWNKMLDKYRLAAAVYNYRQFFRVAFNILETKEKTFKKYKKIFLKVWKKEKLTVEEKRTYNRITHQLYLA